MPRHRKAPGPVAGPCADPLDRRVAGHRRLVPAGRGPPGVMPGVGKLSAVLWQAWREPGARHYFLHKVALLLTAPATMAMVLASTDQVEQGFFFTMLSLLSFQLLADLGFNAGLVYFASH